MKLVPALACGLAAAAFAAGPTQVAAAEQKEPSALAGAASAGSPAGPRWALRLPAQEKIDYRGAVSFDNAGMGTGSMIYPAPGVAGLVAAVLTHAVIVNASRSSEKSALQAEADKVLVPYQDALSTYEPRALFERAVSKLTDVGPPVVIDAKANGAAHWVIESAPVFSMTQDQRALVLDNAVAVFAPGAVPGAGPAYQNIVRIVSIAEPEEGLVARWNADQGARLKERSAELLARSFEIAIGAARQPLADGSAPARTFRYVEGGRERMERAQLVEATCDRVLIRTLRGWLMSIPPRAEDRPAECARDPAPPAASAAASAGAASR